MRTAGEVEAGQLEAASPRDRQEWGMGGSIHTAA